MRILYSIIILIVLSTITTFAAVPPMVNYQGKLTKADGTLLADGTYSMTFAIYNAPTGGLPLWWETNTAVQVKKGLFSVLLGSVIHLPDNIFDNTDRYFGVKVSDDPEITPRQQIASVPFAFRAGSAVNADNATTAVAATTAGIADTVKDGSITAVKIADGVVTTAKIANNTISSVKIKDEAWIDYTPVWSTDGIQPSNGSLKGRYIKIGKTVIYRGYLNINANSQLGTGRWQISLPIRANNVCINYGVVRATKYNTGNWAGYCWSVSPAVLQFNGPSTGSEWTSSLPFDWTPGSTLAWEITYEAE